MVVLTDDVAVDAAERRLLRWYRSADATVKRRGREWYPTMRAILADAARKHGYTLEQAVAVLAITSPGAQLVTNVDWTLEALRTKGRAKVGRFPARMTRDVRAVLRDPERAHEIVSGPKVEPFYRAILGDADSLVIDRWAAFAAGYGAPRQVASGDGLPAADRRAISEAYRRASRKARRKVRDFQATVWIAARENTPDSRGRLRRYADITA